MNVFFDWKWWLTKKNKKNTIWVKVGADIKMNSIVNMSIIKLKFLKTKIKSYGDEVKMFLW